MKNKIIMAVVGLVLLGVGFYGGTLYAKPSANSAGRQFSAQGSFSQGGAGQQRSGQRFAGAGMVGGEVSAKDSSGITVKTKEGSSRIIFLSSSTQVMKSEAGILDDLKVGEQVTVFGKQNSDGSVSAESVQIRPVGVSQPAPMR